MFQMIILIPPGDLHIIMEITLTSPGSSQAVFVRSGQFSQQLVESHWSRARSGGQHWAAIGQLGLKSGNIY